jgi:hypothetical protein
MNLITRVVVASDSAHATSITGINNRKAVNKRYHPIQNYNMIELVGIPFKAAAEFQLSVRCNNGRLQRGQAHLQWL